MQIQCLELVFENVLQKYKLYALFCSRKPCLIALRRFFQFSIISQFHYLRNVKDNPTNIFREGYEEYDSPIFLQIYY